MDRMRWAGIVLIGAAVACGQPPEHRLSSHKAKGSDYVKAGRFDEAILEFRNALEIAPQDKDALFQIGEAYLKKGQVREAFAAYKKVVELDPSNLDAQLRLGNLFLLARSPDEARERAERVLADAPTTSEAHALLGKAYLVEKQIDKGLAEFDEAIRLEPDNLDHRLLKASALLSLGRLPEARSEVGAVLARDASHRKALLLLTQVADRQKDEALAADTFRRLLEAYPEDPGVWLSYGNYWLVQGDLSKAMEGFRKSAEVDPEGTAGLHRVAEVSVTKGDLASAREAVKAIYERDPGSPAGKYDEARILIAERDFRGAAALLEDVVREHPRNAEAHYFLGFAQYGLGRLPLAKASLTKAVDLNPGFAKGKMLLTQVHLDSRDFVGAERLTAELAASGEVPAEVVLLRAAALLGLSRPEDARKLLEKLTEAVPGHSRAQELLGRCYLAEKKPEPALASLRRAVEADPANGSALRLAAQLLVARKKVGDAVALVEAQDKRVGESAERRVLLGRLYGVAGDRERARTELTRAIDLDPDAVEAYLLLAGLHTGPDSARKALADVDRAVERQPTYLQGWILKGSLHDALQEWDAASAAYRRALEAAPDSVAALNNLAWNLSERGGNIDEALKFAERATELMPKSPSVNDTLGWIYIKKGVYMKAVSHLEYAAEGLPETPAVHYHLGKAYAELGEARKAVASLDRALELSKDFEGAEQARELRDRLK